MKRKVLVISLLVPLFIFGFIGFVNAQSVTEATEAYNNALKSATDDPATAIVSAKKCIDLCSQIGEDGDDVKVLAENLLPKLYYQVGTNLLKEKKYPEAIPAYQEALKVAEKYKNNEYLVKSKSMLPKLFNSVGSSYYKKEDYPKAIEALNQAIIYDPDYAKAYYTIGLVYKKMDDPVNFEAMADKGIVAAKNSRDSKTEGLISKASNTFFLAAGTQALTGGKAADAVEMLKKALKYDPEGVDTYFYLANAYNELKQFDAAIEASKKALELEGVDEEKNAKHYYNLGIAYKGKGEKALACEAFNNALFGQFKDNAQYEIEHSLKCNE